MIPDISINPPVKDGGGLTQSIIIVHLTSDVEHSLPQQPAKHIQRSHNRIRVCIGCHKEIQF